MPVLLSYQRNCCSQFLDPRIKGRNIEVHEIFQRRILACLEEMNEVEMPGQNDIVRSDEDEVINLNYYFYIIIQFTLPGTSIGPCSPKRKKLGLLASFEETMADLEVAGFLI